jgi:copper chaperone CopZ
MKFKTNVMCANCIAKVTPYLNKVAGENNWEVDIKDPKKILTVRNEKVKGEEVIHALNEAGYKSELV